MFKFRKYIASLSILGISVQSIFGYSTLMITTGVVVNEMFSTTRLSAADGPILTPNATNSKAPECIGIGDGTFRKAIFYTQSNLDAINSSSGTGAYVPETLYPVSGIVGGTGSFKGYGNTGTVEEYANWATLENAPNPIAYPDATCTPTLDYVVTPLTITGTGITKVQTISSDYGACTGVILSRSGTLYTSTGAQTINDSSPIALSSTGYYEFTEPFPSQPGDYWDIDVTVDGVGICAGRTVTRKHVSKVPQLTFTAQNATITTPGSQTGRIYDVTSQNGICSDVEFTYSDGSPMTSTGVPYNKEDGMISVPTDTYSSVIVTATATGANCSQSPRLSVSQTITTDTRRAPGAPTGVSATAGNGQATVSFSPPSSNGGAAVTSYTVTSSPGNITSTSAGSPITVTGLTNGTSYTFTVTATNLKGTSSPSTPSSSVTPTSGVTPVSGVCGTASGSMQASTPSTNLCTTGTPGSVIDGGVGNNYSWSCGGSGGGTSMSCTASHISATQTGTCSGGLPTNATANAGTGFLQTWNGIIYAPATLGYAPSATGACSFSCNPGYGLSIIDPGGGPVTYMCIPDSGGVIVATGSVTIASPIGTINTGAPRFTGSGGTGVTQVVIYKSGGLFLGSGMVQSGSYSFTSALTLSDGTHTIIVTAKYSLGNSGSTATGTFIVDTLAPTVPTVNPVPNPLTTTTPTFSGSGETGAILEIRSGGTGGVLLCQTTINGSGSWSCTLSSPSLSIGSSSLTFLSRDGVGNMSSTSLTVNVAIPVVSNPVSIGPGGGSYTANAGGGNMGGSSIAIGVQNMLIGRESAIPLDAFLTGRRLSGTSEITQDSIIERENFTEKRARLTENVIGLRDPLPSTEVCTLEEKFSNDDLEFTDISTHWARSFIEKLARYWIVRNQESYRPDATMTRGEFLALAMRAVRCNYDSEALESYSSDGFSDVRKSMTVDKYLGVAQEKGWVEGSGRFRPDDAITRTEAVEMVMNILKPEETNKKIGFLDLGRLKKSTQEMILMAQSFSIVGGKNDGYFDPNSALTRGEAAKIVVRSFVRE